MIESVMQTAEQQKWLPYLMQQNRCLAMRLVRTQDPVRARKRVRHCDLGPRALEDSARPCEVAEFEF